MMNVSELGAEIGRETLSDQEDGNATRRAVDTFTAAVLAVNPRAKVPAIIAKERTIKWMREERVTKTMISQAMAKHRKNLKVDESASNAKARRIRTCKVKTIASVEGAGKNVALIAPTPTHPQDLGLFDENG